MVRPTPVGEGSQWLIIQASPQPSLLTPRWRSNWKPRIPLMQQYDLVVIGSGPGGQRASIQAAKSGKRVAVVEKHATVGGVCINTGTIPSKTMREAVLHLSGFYDQAF